MSGLYARSSTADHDDIRDADRLITFTHSKRIASDGLIGIEISPLGFITHLAPCRLIRRRTAGTSPVLCSGLIAGGW